IYLRHSDNGGDSFAPAVRLTRVAGRSIQPAVAVGGGPPVVVWSDNSGGAFDVFAQIVGVDPAPVNISAAGKTVAEGDRAADARSALFPASLWPSVAVDRHGTIVVTW